MILLLIGGVWRLAQNLKGNMGVHLEVDSDSVVVVGGGSLVVVLVVVARQDSVT